MSFKLYLEKVFSFASMLRCRRQSRVSAEPISRVEPKRTHHTSHSLYESCGRC